MRLAARERRLVAVGLLVAAIALVWLAIVAPILAGFEERRLERERLRLVYALNERIVGGMRATRGEARRQRATAGDWALVAPTPQLAVEALRERVLAAARANGAQVGTAQETQAPTGFVAVRADLTVPVARLDPMVRALENARPPVVVETITITADRSEVAGRAEPVDVRIEVAVPYAGGPGTAP